MSCASAKLVVVNMYQGVTYELNSRGHLAKKNKNALISKEIVSRLQRKEVKLSYQNIMGAKKSNGSQSNEDQIVDVDAIAIIDND
mmetsp:Transcript_5886/g.9538  ORF Transcript_5886/g.9538 Transcript_5886/m.9538 type:complete len:85 (-) Transcript_5886:290-544(-)